MKKLFPTILCIFICLSHAGAAVCSRGYYYHDPNGLATATGTVQATGRNSIEIFDEDRKRPEKFIDVDQQEQYQKGDYVRIYYNPRGAIVVRIRRMTVLEYKENGQNLGNIYYTSMH